MAFSEALKSPGSSEGGLPGLFGASKKGSKRTHKKYVGGIFLDGTHIFYAGGSEVSSGCVLIPILGPSLAMLGPVAEFGLHSVAFSEALKSPGSSEGGLPGVFRATNTKNVGAIFEDVTNIFCVGAFWSLLRSSEEPRQPSLGAARALQSL